ncbi:MAG: rod shape-determining protein MreC [Firmicutes bacterium]|nr:rod shape-determining protein MreC [Bacillota bacterium]
MIELFERHRRIFLLTGIIICIGAVILTVNPSVASSGSNFLQRGLSYIIAPMQRGASAAISWIRGNFSAMTDNQQLLQQIRTLQEENNILRVENDMYRLAAEEIDELIALLEIRRQYDNLPMIGARVIGADIIDWYHRFTVDRGTNDGIANNMAVIGDGGLLGVIRRADPGRSHFISVIDSGFSVAVMSTRTGDIGMASGNLQLMQQNRMRMDRIEATAQIMPGDELRTSIHSSIFPPGILVGTVESIHPNPDGHTRHAIIRPAASLDNIEMVLIVTEVFGDATATRDDFIALDN